MLELKKGRRIQVIQRDVRGLELHVQELHVQELHVQGLHVNELHVQGLHVHDLPLSVLVACMPNKSN
jgi:hypothetical protein